VMMISKVNACGNIQDFSEYVEEIRDIFKTIDDLLKILKFIRSIMLQPTEKIICYQWCLGQNVSEG
jgi:hypothetical protein